MDCRGGQRKEAAAQQIPPTPRAVPALCGASPSQPECPFGGPSERVDRLFGGPLGGVFALRPSGFDWSTDRKGGRYQLEDFFRAFF